MNSLKKIATSAVLAIALSVVGTLGLSGLAGATPYHYDPSTTMVTSKTPVYNNFDNTPENSGPEADFVKVRASNGDPTTSAVTNPFSDSITEACNVGDEYDVRTYVHNNASQDYNNLDVNGNSVAAGTGSAVAHNVKITTTAPLGSYANSFKFSSTISADNAASVTDTGTVNCTAGKNVDLELVPGTVKIYSAYYGWANLSDSTVNGSSLIGSDAPTSGTQLGCWNYRISVVYTVKVVSVPPTPTASAMCTALGVEAGADRKATVNSHAFTAKNATFKSAVINWGDGNTTTLNSESAIDGVNHTYAKDGTYTVSATVTFTSGVDSSAIVSSPTDTPCHANVTFSSGNTPVVTPPATSSTPPTTLVNTGAGNVIGLAVAVAAASAIGYRFYIARRLSRQ